MFELLLFVVVCGVAWYFVQDKVASPFKEIFITLVVLIFVIWLLGLFGYVKVPYPRFIR